MDFKTFPAKPKQFFYCFNFKHKLLNCFNVITVFRYSQHSFPVSLIFLYPGLVKSVDTPDFWKF